MTRQEAQAKPGQARNVHSGEILRHYIFQKIYCDMLQNKKKYISIVGYMNPTLRNT